MKNFKFVIILIYVNCFGKHKNNLHVQVDHLSHIITVNQELTYFNESNDTLKSIVLNDWNNAYAYKNTPLGKRFSDEFIRTYLIAPEKNRGHTFYLKVNNQNKTSLTFFRPENYLDLVEVVLSEPLLPKHKITILLSYKLKLPNARFTTYGFNAKNEISLKNWFLTPARFENNNFICYNNLNLDDAANAPFDLSLEISSDQNYQINTDLNLIKKEASSYFFT